MLQLYCKLMLFYGFSFRKDSLFLYRDIKPDNLLLDSKVCGYVFFGLVLFCFVLFCFNLIF